MRWWLVTCCPVCLVLVIVLSDSFAFRVELLKQSPMIEMNRRKSVRCHSDPG